MASIPFGIEFDRIAPDLPPVLNTAAAAGYDAARRRQTIAFFFFERLRSRCIGRLQRLDGDPANGWKRRFTDLYGRVEDRPSWVVNRPSLRPCRMAWWRRFSALRERVRMPTSR